MKQLLKRLFQILFGIILLILITGIFVTLFFGQEIEKRVTKKIQDQVISELQFGNVDFGFYEKFPSASVKITNLLAFEKEGFDNDTLLYAEKAYVELNVFDVILNQLDIKHVLIVNGSINIKYDAENNPNFEIFKSKEENKNKITLDEIFIENTTIQFKNNNTNINCYASKALVVCEKSNFSINAELFSKKLIVNSHDYIHQKAVKLQTTISFKKDSFLILPETKIHIEDVKLDLYGNIFNKNNINLNFSCSSQNLSAIMEHTPEHLKNIYSSFQANGEFSCTGKVNGLINKTENPLLNMSCHINNGNLNLRSRPFMLKNVSFVSKITNGENRNFITTEINVNEFDAQTNNGFIKGEFTIKNLNTHYLNTNLSSSWDLAEMNQYFENSPFSNLQGELNAKTQYSGNISFDSKFKDYFITAQHASNASFKNASFKYKNFPLPFSFQTADCKFKNNVIKVENSSFTIADSDLRFNGEITNLIAYLLNREKEINVTGDLTSTYIKFDELITIKDINNKKINTEAETNFPNWIKTNLNTTISTFAYNDFISTDLNGIIDYRNLILTGKDLQLKTLNGSGTGNFKFYETSNSQIKLSSKFDLKKINIRKAFLSFNNFKQNFITAEHIKGIGSAKINVQSTWDPGFIFNDSELKLKSHLVVEKGELIQFKPLESLSDFVKLKDLKNVKFSTLENTIDINNNVIAIPVMEIKSSALSVFLSGTHNFNQEIDYRIKLLLSELMSAKFRKKNTQIKSAEFGEIKENGEIFSTIYFKMTGISSEPKISFDGIRFREDVQKAIAKEKDVLSTIIKEDVLQTKEKPENNENIIIEWDDK